MERLTIRRNHGITMALGYDFGIDPDDYDLVQEILSRLAAYEDTGLEPETIKKAFNEEALLKLVSQYLKTTPERLRDLLQAEQEGRLVVLPCKVGDFVYRVHYKEIRRHHVCQVHIGQTPAQTFFSCYGEYFGIEDFGKTVFLTREEAEAALVADINVGNIEGGST